MKLKAKWRGHKKKGEVAHNEWRIGKEDNADCSFPPDIRIKELGLKHLGTTKEGLSRYRGMERGRNYLLLKVLPKTDKEKLKAFVAEIGLESR